jgi:tetratricopeptide (TPR) repeat protein
MTHARTAAIAAVAALLLGGWDLLRAPDDDIADGNGRFSAGDYDDALAAYRRARARRAAADPDRAHPAIDFDIGAALYKLAEASAPDARAQQPAHAEPGQPGAEPDESGAAANPARRLALTQAEEAFRRATRSDDPQLEALAHYNLGNTLYRLDRLDEAVDAYKRALRLDPDNDDARYNLELIQRQRQPPPPQGGQGSPQPGDPSAPDSTTPSDPNSGQSGPQNGPSDQPPPLDQPVDPAPSPDDSQNPSDPGSQDDSGNSGEPSDSSEQNGSDKQTDPSDASANPDSSSDPSDGSQDSPDDPDPNDGDSKPSSDPSSGHNDAKDRKPRDADGGDRASDGEREIKDKLDALERQSRALRRDRFRHSGRSRGTDRARPIQDW